MHSQRCMEEKKRKRAAQEEDEEEAAFITTDLFTEILSWLPSGDLLTFKRVCKDWLQLISSPSFIQKHLERSNSCRNRASILKANKNDIVISYLVKNIPSKKIPWSGAHLVGSCDGLVLSWLPDLQIAAVNPSTGKSVIGIPNDEFANNDIISLDAAAMIFTWFGHHPSTGEYVFSLARMSVEPSGLAFHVYSLSRKVNVLICSLIEPLSDWSFYLCLQKVGTSLHGRLHCASTFIHDIHDHTETAVSEACILVYHFETNKIVRMGTPTHWKDVLLGVVDGCLSAFFKGAGFELWMMKEYGVTESWTKYANIESGFNIIRKFLSPLAFSPMVCNDSFVSPIACIDSLVSPASVWMGRRTS